ncbi:methylmalonyl-CoA mutase family protein [Candidatus Woesearchaeota archaeon]|nr:methylmalonyl-CoA mutase family protein [Candidatus Woesearchaeota archaeon]
MTKKNYEDLVKKTTARFPEIKKEFKTNSKLDVKRLYTKDDVKIDYDSELGYPGLYPYTRGVQPTMYRGRTWTMRQYAGFGSAKETNKRFKYLLKQGQTGLSIAFDLPTQLGYDSDNPVAKGEVGRVGVAIDTLKDLEEVFNGIFLDKVSTSMTINSTAIVLIAMYIAIAQKNNINLDKLRGTIQNDVLKEYFARGTYIYPPKQSMRIITDIFEYCSKNLPNFNTISISGYHAREAGCTAVQELAFTFGDAIEYVKSAINIGLNVDDFAPRLSFFFSVDNDFFEEIAKFRAARKIWAKLMKDKFKAENQKSMTMKFHCQTSGASLTAHEPENNIVRVTLQALAAVLGGTQSLHTNSKDEALALPSEESVRTALRTQQIIAEESNVINTIDPLGGSYYVESLTKKIEDETFKLIEEIEKKGGMISCIESGFIQKEIQKQAYSYQKEIEEKKKIVVGVNKYALDKKADIKLLKVNPEVESLQIKNLEKIKQKRNNEKIRQLLIQLKKIAESDENLMPIIIECVKEYATLQEICDVLRQVFTEYKVVEIL